MKHLLAIAAIMLFTACAHAYEPPLDDVKTPLERNEATGELVVPDWCIAWFDGCNNCGRGPGGHDVCTQKACEGKTDEAYCTKHKGEKND